MDKKVLDYTLVPLGLFIMMAYHAWLLHRIVKHPTKTVVGVTAINRRFWVQAMMEVMWFVSLLSFVSPEMLLDLSSFSWRPTCVAGCLQDRRSRGPNAEEQHNGVDSVGLDGDHPQLPHRRPHDQRERQPILALHLRRPEQVRFLREVLRHPRVLLGGFPSERSVRKVLQPREHPNQRAIQEDITAPAPAPGDGRVCGHDGE